MNFKDFYKELIFDIDKPILRRFTAKQGDTKSRGFYVPVMQNGAIVDVVDESMTFYAQKPDGTRVFQNAVKEGGLFRIDLKNQVFAVAGVVKCELTLYGTDGEKITNKTFTIEVEPSLSDDSIVSEDERGVIDDALEFVEEYVPRLELIDIDSLENYQEVVENNKVKISTVEKELSDYKRTISGINVNQEAKQEASGYGIVSLPKNAANGQVSGVVRGLTATNIIKNGDFSKGLDNWERIALPHYAVNDGVAEYIGSTTSTPRIQQLLNLPEGHLCYKVAVIKSTSDKVGLGNTTAPIAFHSGSGNFERLSFINTYSYIGIADRRTEDFDKVYIKEVMAVDLTATFGVGNEPDLETCNKIFANWFDGTKSTIGSARISSADDTGEVKDKAYVTAVKDGKIVSLRSLPNGVADEIDLEQGKMIKRVSDWITLDGSEDWDYLNATGTNRRIQIDLTKNNLPQVAPYGGIFAKFTSGETIPLTRWDGEEAGIQVNDNGTIWFFRFLDTMSITDWKNFLSQNPITLIYQLAEPEIIPVQVSGSVISHPSGTVYIDPATTVAGVYMGGIPVTHTDLPIKELERITVIDYSTGLETELDVSQAVISEDRLLFTHPDLSDGDIVFFEYEYDVETTQGETTIQYYDSRYTIKDSVTGKFYKWEIKVADGVPSIELVEV